MSEPPATTPQPRRLVFVSHSSEDTPIARQIADRIEERGAAAFLDVNAIEVGMDFLDVIVEHLRRADELVVLWTAAALESRFVLTEVSIAWFRDIPIIQVVHGMTIGEMEVHPLLPLFLRSLHMTTLDELDTYLEQLARRVADSTARRRGG